MGLLDVQATQMSMVTCAKCYMRFAMFDTHTAQLRENHQTFYCPSGHGQSYTGQTEADKLRARVASEERVNNSLREQLAKANTNARKVSCPKCSAKVLDLKRHMKRVHP